MLEPIIVGQQGMTIERVRKSTGIKYGGKGLHLPGRVLRPCEYVAIRNVIKHDLSEVTNLDCALLIAARYVELQRIQEHSEWFDGESIVINNTKQKAIEASGSQRWIRLSDKGKSIIPYFFKNKTTRYLPTVQAFDQKLKRWAILADVSTKHLSAKCLRKTYESWLNFCYPNYVSFIAQSQGHTDLTAMKHYVRVTGLSDRDKDDMKEWVSGWKPKSVDW